MKEGDGLSPLELAAIELIKNTNEIKTTNLRLKELVEINSRRIAWIEHPWWKKLFGFKPTEWQ
ncbi:MAG: hypothetical protein RIF33_11445 [Cyclobacteriaceae bacterium]